MKSSTITKRRTIFVVLLAAGSLCTSSWGAELNSLTFTADHKDKIQGVILSHEGDTLKIRTDGDSVAIVDLTESTKVHLKRRFFSTSSAVRPDALVVGLEIKAEGKGNERGELVATKVSFDPNAMRVSHQVDARVDPVANRTTALEARSGQLEDRASQLETGQSQLSDQEKQTEQQVVQVQGKVDQVDAKADHANQGVSSVNDRVTNLDSYKDKYSETVYFRLGSSTLTAEGKQKLDNLAQQTRNEKGYVVQVAGFADITGSSVYNQELSERRAIAVKQYLEEHGDIPIYRIITPAGMGTTHALADNKTSSGRKLNRRVEVTVLVNEGIVVDPTWCTPT
jgi:outer membrane protein OmpA-like peptidoglycan-associated protein